MQAGFARRRASGDLQAAQAFDDPESKHCLHSGNCNRRALARGLKVQDHGDVK
jgi:hypothetical protein